MTLIDADALLTDINEQEKIIRKNTLENIARIETFEVAKMLIYAQPQYREEMINKDDR